MNESILIGRASEISRIPRQTWESELEMAPALIAERLRFMTQDHHRVRNYVVQEMPRRGRSISLRDISEALRLTEERAATIVEELEKNRFFLVRGDGRDVSWAFPVTVDETRHHLVFSTGERLDAA